MYQSLRKYLPATEKDTRSIHFVDFPQVNEDYFDPVIERKVSRMQSIIELTRYLREKYQPSLKVRSILSSRRVSDRHGLGTIQTAQRLPPRPCLL